MTTSAQVQAIWAELFMLPAAFVGYTDKFYPYDIVNQSEKVASSLYDSSNRIQFFTYLVGRRSQKRVTGELRHDFIVECTYYTESDPAGEAWTRARNSLEVLLDVVRLNSDGTWENTVDFWQPDTQFPELIEVDVDDARCWRARTRFSATKSLSL
jgi:hypothetical protein